MGAPESHEWRKVGKALWHCSWCDSYAKGHKRPSPENRPSQDARKQAEMLGLTNRSNRDG